MLDALLTDFSHVQAHVMMHLLRGSEVTQSCVDAAVAESSKRTHALYDDFKQQAVATVLFQSLILTVY